MNKYDILGRDSVWSRPDGTTTFNYHTTGSAKGKISQIDAPTETKKYNYDSMGRIIRICDSINLNEKMVFSYEYDSYGRVSKMTYPTGYYVTYHYNNYGYLSQIKDGNTSAVIWQCNEMNSWGYITNFALSSGNIPVVRKFDSNGNITEIKTTANGNLKQWFGYSFSAPTGNLTWRRDSIRHLTERFKYDLHDRLISYKGTGRDIVTMSFDDIGNITSKTDVGEYTYNSQRVHAVESLEPIEPLNLFGRQRIIYNYMNLPHYISNDNDSLVYTYGIGVNRIKCVQYQSGQLTGTTWYGDNFERIVEGSTEKFYHWIQSPDGPVALVVIVTGGATTTYYLSRDHLNSITGVMDAFGTIQEEYSYDPWGRRRSPSDWSYNVTMPTITRKGFTGHEHLDDFKLIHMNGRIYDPHIARILNPDPVIQEPLNIQNYNRYSYCSNNPLKYTDPSGYSPSSIEIWKAYLNTCLRSGRYLDYGDFYNNVLNQYYAYIHGGGGSGGSMSTSRTGTTKLSITYYWKEKVQYYLPLEPGNTTFDEETDAFQMPGVPIIPPTYITNSYTFTINSSVEEEVAIGKFVSDYYDNKATRAGGYGKETPIAINGTNSLISLAALGIKEVKNVTRTIGYIMDLYNLGSIIFDKPFNQMSYGDIARVLYTGAIGFGDLLAPGSGFFNGVLESYGVFEYDYQQWDTLEETGYWVYFNKYTYKWQGIKLKH